MKLFISRIVILVNLIILFSFFASGNSLVPPVDEKAADTVSFVSRFEAENNRCFKCHGQEKYEYTNATLGKQVNAMMCTERIIKKNDFYSSNHRSFNCTDCHAEEYLKFPHSGELRMQQ
jgi:hypothetical protein